jgi:hypothetical protein
MISVVSSEDDISIWKGQTFFLKTRGHCHSGIAWFGKRCI